MHKLLSQALSLLQGIAIMCTAVSERSLIEHLVRYAHIEPDVSSHTSPGLRLFQLSAQEKWYLKQGRHAQKHLQFHPEKLKS